MAVEVVVLVVRTPQPRQQFPAALVENLARMFLEEVVQLAPTAQRQPRAALVPLGQRQTPLKVVLAVVEVARPSLHPVLAVTVVQIGRAHV